jgi:dTDP-4-dehydrorhamnose reductase
MNPMRVLVAGAAGQLGGAIVQAFTPLHDVTGLTREQLDVSDARAVTAAVSQARPEVIINCSANNQVDAAEDAPLPALEANAWGPRLLARAAADTGAMLVHYSTDFVFDGDATQPYTETDAPRPRSTYGMSKLLGEWFAAGAGRHYVLRVESLFGGPRAKSSIDVLLNAIVNGDEARAFSDRVVSPSYVEDVATATLALVTQAAPFGLYHCVNTGSATWLDVAHELARLAGRPDARIRAVSVADVKLRASRPTYAALSNAKLRAAGVDMPTWQDAVGRYVAGRLRS